MKDEDIIQLFEVRSESAIDLLATKYGGYCFSIAKNILGNNEDSEECVNDCYLGTWNTIPPTKPASLTAYVCRLTRNIAIKKYHSKTAKKRNSTYDISFNELKYVITDINNPEHQLFAKELTQYLNQFLKSLDKETQIIFMLRYWYSDSTEEIGKKLSLKPNTVTVKLKRTREKLKKFLIEKEYDYE